MRRLVFKLALAIWALSPEASAATLLRIVNPHGAVEVRVEPISQLRLTKQGLRRPVVPEDVAIHATPNEVSISVQPPDGQPIDILAEVPYGTNLEVETRAGAISLTGLFETAELKTVSGEVRLRAPWSQTPLDYRCEEPLGVTAIPPELGFSVKAKAVRSRGPKGQRQWLEGIQVRSREAGGLVIEDMQLPADSRVLLMQDAAKLADEIVDGGAGAGLKTVQVFIAGPEGLPVSGIQAEDFEVLSKGKELTVEQVQSPDDPLNVVVLADRSASMRVNEEIVAESVVSILQQLRPGDSAALHAMAFGRLHILHPLSEDPLPIVAAIDRIPKAVGSSPMTGALVLSSWLGLPRQTGARNMLIFLSDGVAPDSTKDVGGVPKGKFKQTQRRLAAPIFVMVPPQLTMDPMRRPIRYIWQKLDEFEGLIEDGGGRVLPAREFELSDMALLHSIVRGTYTLVVRTPDDFDPDAKFQVKMRGASDLVVWHSGAGY